MKNSTFGKQWFNSESSEEQQFPLLLRFCVVQSAAQKLKQFRWVYEGHISGRSSSVNATLSFIPLLSSDATQ